MRRIAMLVAVLSLGGCMSTGVKVDPDKLTSFQKGRTTYAEVVQKLGPPTQNDIHADGARTAIYRYMHSQQNATNFIPIVGWFANGATTENTSVTLNFDKHSLLVDYSSSEGGTDISTGIANGAKQ